MNWIDLVVQDVAELDCNSPEGQSDVMLVKASELRAILESRDPMAPDTTMLAVHVEGPDGDSAFIDAIPRLGGDPQEPDGDDGDYLLPSPPVGHPLHTLGARLAELLDEDQWGECERMLSEGWDQDRVDRKTGADWRQNSSLEVWFPMTSEALNAARSAELKAAQEADELRATLRLFIRAATPVSTEIAARGYSWSGAYLDQALASALDLGRLGPLRRRT